MNCLQYSSSSSRLLSRALALSCLTVALASPLCPQSGSGKLPPGRSDFLLLLKQGKSLAAEGRLAEAEVPLIAARKLAPDDLQALTTLAKVQGRLGKSAEAILLFRKAVGLYPRTADCHLDLAIALADGGDLTEALKETSAAVALAPRMAAAHLNRARILDDLHLAAEARDEFVTASTLDPGNPDTLYYWALLERESGNLTKESQLLQRLVALQPDNYKAVFFLGRSLQEQSRDSDAIPLLRRALRLKPDSEEALYLLSRELRRSNPEEAAKLLAEFQTVRQRQSAVDAGKSLGNEAYVAAQRQNWPEAIRLLKEAIEVCNGCDASAGLHKNLGLALCKNGNIEEGTNELKTSLELNPNDPDVVRALGIVSR